MEKGTIRLIDTAEELERLAAALAGQPWIALDTEFLRDNTYFPQLCLLQVAYDDEVACVDPIALASLDALLDVLYDSGITKVMHASRQDLEIFFHLRGRVPAPVFDTQIAAPLLGYADQIGYANLVERVLGERLAKSHTRADWSRRPLPEAWLRYAADDVLYLGRTYLRMREELQRRGRLHWPDQDFAALASPALYQNAPEEAWRRIRGTDRLSAVQLGALRQLAAWRELTAQQEDRPRMWLLRDEVLIDLARALPQSEQDLQGFRGLGERVLKRHAAGILAAIARGRQEPLPPQALGARAPQLTPEQEALADALSALVRLRGAEQAVNPGVLAGRRELENLVLGLRDGDVLRGWRGEMVGRELLAFLDGRVALTVQDGRLRTSPVAQPAVESSD